MNEQILAIGNSNWDYKLQIYNDGSVGVLSIAKEGSGANDSCFGNVRHFINCYRKGWVGSLTEAGEKLIYKF